MMAWDNLVLEPHLLSYGNKDPEFQTEDICYKHFWLTA